MFYYGLDFHDLAPDSFLHISAFIVVCEAFLRITPHFGLWLKTFDVKLKMVEGQHVACGGALISKIAGAPWFLSRGVRIMATGVVLHHSSQKCQVGGCPCFPLGPSTTTDVMD